MKRSHIALFIAIIAMPALAGGDRTQSPSRTSPDADAPAFAAGQVLIIDSSGKITSGTPQTTDLRAGLGDALSTSSEGLVEEKSPVAGGGMMINLQGRFQNAVTIEKDADGNVTAAPCVTGTAAETTPEVK